MPTTRSAASDADESHVEVRDPADSRPASPVFATALDLQQMQENMSAMIQRNMDSMMEQFRSMSPPSVSTYQSPVPSASSVSNPVSPIAPSPPSVTVPSFVGPLFTGEATGVKAREHLARLRRHYLISPHAFQGVEGEHRRIHIARMSMTGAAGLWFDQFDAISSASFSTWSDFERSFSSTWLASEGVVNPVTGLLSLRCTTASAVPAFLPRFSAHLSACVVTSTTAVAIFRSLLPAAVAAHAESMRAQRFGQSTDWPTIEGFMDAVRTAPSVLSPASLDPKPVRGYAAAVRNPSSPRPSSPPPTLVPSAAAATTARWSLSELAGVRPSGLSPEEARAFGDAREAGRLCRYCGGAGHVKETCARLAAKDRDAGKGQART